MEWLIFTFIAMVFWAIVNIMDKHIIDGDLRDEITVVTVFGFLISTLFIVVAWFYNHNIWHSEISIFAILAGVVYSIALWFYYYVMRREEVSRFVPTVGLEPIFASIIAFFLFDEHFAFINYLGMVLVLLGVIIISHKTDKKKLESKYLIFFVLASILLFVARNILIKYTAVQGIDFWTTIFWTGIGGFIVPLIFLIRHHPHLRKRGWTGVHHLALNAVLSGVALICFAKAIILGSVSLSSAVLATKPLLVFFMVLFLSFFSPKIIRERMTHKVFLIRLMAIIIIVIGGILVVL